MRALFRTVAVYATVATVLVWTAPFRSAAAMGGGRLEGLVVGIDGQPAEGHRVHLIDGKGRALDQSGLDAEGLYSFRDLAPGEYSLGIETPEGQFAPVAAPPLRLGDGELARRDLKLVEANPGATSRALEGNYGLGMWWASLSAPGKAWTIVAIVVAVVLTVEALEDEGSKF